MELKEFLKKHYAKQYRYELSEDMDLKEFLEKCDEGDFILWLFSRTNPDSIREITLAKGHCVNTVRHLMKDERSRDAVDAAIAFGEGEMEETVLRKYRKESLTAAYGMSLKKRDNLTTKVAEAAHFAVACFVGLGLDNQKETADICRKYLPIEIWNELT